MTPEHKIIFEDDALLVVNKPNGLSTIAERDLSVPCLHKSLEAEAKTKLWIVHRLDKEVSGIVLFAKNAEIHRELSMAFEHREVTKTYLAIVSGQVNFDKKVVDSPIRECGSGRMAVDAKRGKPSTTEFQKLSSSKTLSLLSAHPVTGRRHQIRVHLYSLGYPICGDSLYGDKQKQSQFERLFLHSHKIAFRLNNNVHSYSSSIPDSFVSILQAHRCPLPEFTGLRFSS